MHSIHKRQNGLHINSGLHFMEFLPECGTKLAFLRPLYMQSKEEK